MLDMRGVILAKSDQLNAEDLIAAPMVLKITNVTLVNSDSQNVIIDYEGGEGRPYKPSKGMVKALSSLWSYDGHQWIGKSVRVYMEPTAVYAGKETGGIRINGVSDIDCDKKITISESRYKKVTYLVEKLTIENPAQQRPVWPDDKFKEQLPKIKAAIESGSSTSEKVIESLMGPADLTDAQIAEISKFQPVSDDDFFNEESK